MTDYWICSKCETRVTWSNDIWNCPNCGKRWTNESQRSGSSNSGILSRQEAIDLWYGGYWASRDSHYEEARKKLRKARDALVTHGDYHQASWISLDLVFTYLQQGELLAARGEFASLAGQIFDSFSFTSCSRF